MTTTIQKIRLPEPAIAITGFTLTDGDPLVCLTATVRVSSPCNGEAEYTCSMTLDQRRRTSPLGLTWHMGGIPVHYRRAVQHLVTDLADQVLTGEQARQTQGRSAAPKGGSVL